VVHPDAAVSLVNAALPHDSLKKIVQSGYEAAASSRSTLPNDFLTPELLIEFLVGCFCLADAVLNLPCRLFDFPFGFQSGAIRNLSGFFLDCPMHFVQAALDLVFCAVFHIFSSLLNKA
jgi:hypothetical protein